MDSKIVFGAVASLLASGAMFSSTSAMALTPFGEMGIYVGGDNLVTAEYTNGDTSSIDAGGELDLSAGIIFPISGALEGQFSVGYRFDTIHASNADINWRRYPVEMKAFYKTEKFRFGGGVTEHFNPELSGTGVAAGSVHFDNALGMVIEVDYSVTDKAYLGLKYTNIDYEVGSVAFNGDSAGLIFGYVFH